MVTTRPFSSRRRLLKSREVAEMLGVTRQRVHRLAQLGVLYPVRLVPGGDLRFRVEDVERLIQGNGKSP
ncbi:MAG: helix-turn-helix domain-containing protein [Gaiellaceae bacterium]|jgi:excisionase family DNA binding protein